MIKDIYIGETYKYTLYAHVRVWIEPGCYDRELGCQIVEDGVDYVIENIVSKDKDGTEEASSIHEFPKHLIEEFQNTVANNLPAISEIKNDY
jgi:hypothetical protein